MIYVDNITIIVNDAGKMSLNGKDIAFEGTCKAPGIQLISVAATDISQAILKAVEEAKKRGKNYPYVQISIERPSAKMTDPTDPYLHVMPPDNKYYLFNASFFSAGVLVD